MLVFSIEFVNLYRILNIDFNRKILIDENSFNLNLYEEKILKKIIKFKIAYLGTLFF